MKFILFYSNNILNQNHSFLLLIIKANKTKQSIHPSFFFFTSMKTLTINKATQLSF